MEHRRSVTLSAKLLAFAWSGVQRRHDSAASDNFRPVVTRRPGSGLGGGHAARAARDQEDRQVQASRAQPAVFDLEPGQAGRLPGRRGGDRRHWPRGPAGPAPRGGRLVSTREDLEDLEGSRLRGEEGPRRAPLRHRRRRGDAREGRAGSGVLHGRVRPAQPATPSRKSVGRVRRQAQGPRPRAAAQMQQPLRKIYFTPSDTRDAGYIETEHFGVRFPHRSSYVDLSCITQRWLRDLLWDHIRRRAALTHLPAQRPAGGLRTPCRRRTVRVLGGRGARRRPRPHRAARRARPPLRRGPAQPRAPWPYLPRPGPPGRQKAEGHRKLAPTGVQLRPVPAARRAGQRRAERIGLDRAFIAAMPVGGPGTPRSRNPFPDQVARALADEANLQQLADGYDPRDRGLRDMWETIIAGNRAALGCCRRVGCPGSMARAKAWCGRSTTSTWRSAWVGAWL